jgi:hypothetical protein
MCAVFPFAERHSEPEQFGGPSPSHRRRNSFTVKILRVSYLQSRIWRHIQSLEIGNLNKTQQFSDIVPRANPRQFATNSFVWKILRVNSLESRFCSPNGRHRRAKLFVIKILSHQDKKRRAPISLIPLQAFPRTCFPAG